MGTAPSDEIDLSKEYKLSKTVLKKYVLLDRIHRKQIEDLINAIRVYLHDETRKRPLNVMMMADPGSGKSFFINCLAETMERDNVRAVNFNMSSLRGIEDFEQPLDAVRNLKVDDKVPLLFLDEFDSNEDSYPLLLPLLWDGELHLGHRLLKLGKVIIILAGSGSHIQDEMREAKGMMQKANLGKGSKLVDLLSRINGGDLEIPDLDLVTEERDRRVDKICLSISLLQSRFSSRLEVVPWALLKFIAHSRFRYGVRSIAHLIELIPAFPPNNENKTELGLKDLHLSFGSSKSLKNSSLAYHLIGEDGSASVIDLWSTVKNCTTSVRILKPPSENPLQQLFRMWGSVR